MSDTMTDSGLDAHLAQDSALHAVRRVYNRHGVPLPSALAPNDVDLINQNLSEAMKEGNLADYLIDGVAKGSIWELFLKYYVFTYSDRMRWGYEFRTQLPIGWGSDVPSAPVGQVILRWTTEGRCTAKLIARGPVTIPGAKDIQTLTEQLRTRFGIRVVNRGRAWTAEHLHVVYRTLLRVPRPDRAALEGVVLVRMASVEDGEPDIGAYYRANQRFDGNSVVDVHELQVGDETFADDGRAFVRSTAGMAAPASSYIILHEVGHAVEKQATRHAFSEVMASGLELDRAGAVLQASGQTAPREQEERYERAHWRHETARAALQAVEGQSYRSRRLEKFVTYVQDRRVNRRITDYASDSWQQGRPQEFYAGAYALWLLDPDFLQSCSADLFDYFDSGAHRSDA